MFECVHVCECVCTCVIVYVLVCVFITIMNKETDAMRFIVWELEGAEQRLAEVEMHDLVTFLIKTK